MLVGLFRGWLCVVRGYLVIYTYLHSFPPLTPLLTPLFPSYLTPSPPLPHPDTDIQSLRQRARRVVTWHDICKWLCQVYNSLHTHSLSPLPTHHITVLPPFLVNHVSGPLCMDLKNDSVQSQVIAVR